MWSGYEASGSRISSRKLNTILKINKNMELDMEYECV